ncbi:phage portal protein, partial [Yersinia enterocolitica]
MSKRKGRKASSRPATNHTASQQQPVEAFTFGEPSAVLDKREILDYIECTG